MMQSIIAIIFDFDDTLAEDSTDFLLREYRISTESFWSRVEVMVAKGWDPPLAYMWRILEYVKSGKMADLTRSRLRDIGARVPLYPGLPELFEDLHRFVKSIRGFQDTGVTLRFYIVSGGLEDIMKGSGVAAHMHGIFGCNFAFSAKTHLPMGIKSAVTFTEKTKFLFAINKGLSGRMIRNKPYSVNDSVPTERRPIPFRNMVYIGDGPSDIPCFSLVVSNGGNGIGVLKSSRRAYELARGRRTTVGPYTPDYRPGTDMRRMIKEVIQDIGHNIVVKSKQSWVGERVYR
jgi:phosphoglycolate phosphatase-like HAD superfamily hydrolase